MESLLTPADAFAKAVAALGGHTATAALLGKQQPAVSKRIKARKPAQPDEVLKLEAATGVSRHDLRPDIYPRSEVPTGTSTDSLEPDMAAAR